MNQKSEENEPPKMQSLSVGKYVPDCYKKIVLLTRMPVEDTSFDLQHLPWCLPVRTTNRAYKCNVTDESSELTHQLHHAPRKSRNMRKNVPDISLLSCPIIHELPLIRKDIFHFRLPVKHTHIRRKGRSIPPIFEIIH